MLPLCDKRILVRDRVCFPSASFRNFVLVFSPPCRSAPGRHEPEWHFLAVSGQFHDLVKRTKNRDYVRAEHPPEERLVAPISWATLGTHVVASPGSRAALEVGGLSVRNFFASLLRS